ncbi:UV radiation resistance-associated protein [Planococcus citri]|uniref:UV radiation resistance-associated protein n=1 Tax=Planococcus citri TaxID=170843 RepID=UPI0031F78EA0
MSSLMLQHFHVRWKEWIPLVTQQQRLRNLIQVIGYNIGRNVENRSKNNKDVYYYYTLHLATMCAPFYTSEKIAKEHPKWSEINFSNIDPSFGSVTGIVIRVWEHYENEDNIVTVWGVYFSGLSYIGPQIATEQLSKFSKNTLVFYMHGGYFTSSEYLLNDEPTLARISTMSLNHNDVRKSYTLDNLLRLHNIQRSIKEQTEESMALHDKILAGEFPDEKSQIRESSPFLRKLLKQTKPARVPLEEILAVKKQIEAKKFQVQLLQEQKSYRLNEMKKKIEFLNRLRESNAEESSKLKEKYQTLQKDMDTLKIWKKSLLDSKEILSNVKSRYTYRQKQLIAELAFIYPIKSIDNKYFICDVHLPDSEDFDGKDDTSLSVALGFTAHLVQMISFIINIPLRYPVIHFGSRSKIVDHIIDQLPDKNREFPLFARGKEKLQFDYAVFLLNRNIAQLQWNCGIRTNDLRVTLKNLETMLLMHSTQKSVINETRLSSDDLAKLTTLTKSTITFNNIPFSFNHRQNDKLSSSVDNNSDRWEEKKRTVVDSPQRSASISREDGHSSDSCEHDFEHQAYINKLNLTNDKLHRSSLKEGKK